jgi:flagellar protein FliS
MGIEMQDDGTLQVNSSVFNNTLNNDYQDFQNFFQSLSPQGFGNFFGTQMTQMTDPSQGPIALDVAGLQQTNQSLTSDINDFEARMTSLQQQLTQQYSAVNATLEEYPMLMQEISSQLDTAHQQRQQQWHQRLAAMKNTLEAKLAYRENAVRCATPIELVVILFDAAIDDMRRAVSAIKASDIEQRGTAIRHAMLILQQLQGTLDFEKGAPVARQFEQFYNVIRAKLLESQLRNSPQLVSCPK